MPTAMAVLQVASWALLLPLGGLTSSHSSSSPTSFSVHRAPTHTASERTTVGRALRTQAEQPPSPRIVELSPSTERTPPASLRPGAKEKKESGGEVGLPGAPPGRGGGGAVSVWRLLRVACDVGLDVAIVCAHGQR